MATSESTATPTSVYRYYDRTGLLIYVGITKQGIGRNLQHNGKAEWWPHVVRQDVEHYPNRPAAAAREKALIREFRPPFNKQHNPWHAEAREAYLDFTDVHVPDEDPYAQYMRLGKLLPFDVVECDPAAQRIVLRSSIYHASLANSLVLTKQLAPIRCGRKIGWVDEITRTGPFTYLRGLVNQFCPEDITPVRALIGWQQTQKPHHAFLRQILAGPDVIPLIARAAVRV